MGISLSANFGSNEYSPGMLHDLNYTVPPQMISKYLAECYFRYEVKAQLFFRRPDQFHKIAIRVPYKKQLVIGALHPTCFFDTVFLQSI